MTMKTRESNESSPARPTGIAAVIELMQSHADIAGIQEHGCAMLGVLVNHNKDNKHSIASSGGVQVIVNAMKTYPKNAGLQANGMDTLARLAFRDEDKQKAIVKEGAVAAILAAMELHTQDDDVQTNGCGVLLILAPNLGDVEKGRGVSAIQNALRQHPSADRMQEFGHAAMVSLQS